MVDSIAATAGGFREAVSYIAARLGFSLASLLDEKAALTHAHTGTVKYKKAKGVTARYVSRRTMPWEQPARWRRRWKMRQRSPRCHP